MQSEMSAFQEHTKCESTSKFTANPKEKQLIKHGFLGANDATAPTHFKTGARVWTLAETELYIAKLSRLAKVALRLTSMSRAVLASRGGQSHRVFNLECLVRDLRIPTGCRVGFAVSALV